jgi:hypothetical protein
MTLFACAEMRALRINLVRPPENLSSHKWLACPGLSGDFRFGPLAGASYAYPVLDTTSFPPE